MFNPKKVEQVAVAVGLVALIFFSASWAGWIDDDIATWSFMALLITSHFIRPRATWFAALKFFVPLSFFIYFYFLIRIYRGAGLGGEGWEFVFLLILAAVIGLHLLIGTALGLWRKDYLVAGLGVVGLVLVILFSSSAGLGTLLRHTFSIPSGDVGAFEVVDN